MNTTKAIRAAAEADPGMLAILVAEGSKTSLQRLRRAAAERVERLIAFLDETDGDPDLEETGEAEPDEDGEPTLGWPEHVGRRAGRLSHAGMLVQALGGEAEDGGDREPSLGSRTSCGIPGTKSWPEPHRLSQLGWATGGTSDREADAGDEPEAVNEDGSDAWSVS